MLDSTRLADWRWFPTDLNVAVTRMKNKVVYSNETRWFQGPTFLHCHGEYWPKTVSKDHDDGCEEELRPKFKLFVFLNSIIDLIVSLAWVLRFVERKKSKNIKRCFAAAELRCADTSLRLIAKEESIAKEFENLKSSSNVPRSNYLYTVLPYIDENKCLCVYGRIDTANWLALDSQSPIILSLNYHLEETVFPGDLILIYDPAVSHREWRRCVHEQLWCYSSS